MILFSYNSAYFSGGAIYPALTGNKTPTSRLRVYKGLSSQNRPYRTAIPIL
ncbi:hypothetical protein [Bacillus rubiinfantis]|uniref:hypothetical protein n=1 Tax=Bacillus rubiinfantis TaxID=1499680 RepID=UPI003CCC5C34